MLLVLESTNLDLKGGCTMFNIFWNGSNRMRSRLVMLA